MYQEYFDIAYNYVSHQVTTNHFFNAAALSGVALAAWGTLRGVPYRIWGRIHRHIFYSMTIEQQDVLFNYIDEWVQGRFPDDLRKVEAFTRDGELLATHENDYTFIWHKWRRIRISKVKEKLESATDLYNRYNRTYHFSGLAARKQINELVRTILKEGIARMESLKKEKKAIKIYTVSRYGGWDGSKSQSSQKTFDKVYLSAKDTLVNDLEAFKSKEELYDSLGIPFKRGYMFYGKPGNGKSTLAFAMAERMKYDIYILDLAAVKDDAFVSTVNSIPSGSIVLLEDIDNFYNKRTPSKDNKINFSTFLNTLSGVAQKNHIITVMTTNDINAIDDALLRAGRCDVKIELENPSKEIAEKYLSDVFKEEVVLDSYNEALSFSALQEVVVSNINNLENVKQAIVCTQKK